AANYPSRSSSTRTLVTSSRTRRYETAWFGQVTSTAASMMSSRRLEYVFGEATLGRAEPYLDEPDGRHAAQPWRRQRRTAAAGHCAVKLITRTRDPFERSISACEQISSSMSATSISVVGRHCKVLGISPGQIRHAEPSLSSTRWLLSCLLICIADLPYN